MLACADSVFSVLSVVVRSLYRLMICGVQQKKRRAEMTCDDATVARSTHAVQVRVSSTCWRLLSDRCMRCPSIYHRTTSIRISMGFYTCIDDKVHPGVRTNWMMVRICYAYGASKSFRTFLLLLSAVCLNRSSICIQHVAVGILCLLIMCCVQEKIGVDLLQRHIRRAFEARGVCVKFTTVTRHLTFNNKRSRFIGLDSSPHCIQNHGVVA